jgi:ATP-dependent DNA helicase RecG
LDNKTYTKAILSKKISDGKVDIIIGTHALLYGSKFKNLGIIIIDEQHRFGVEQRARLIKQHSDNNAPPHLLSMTATPIPRTLALTLYSDLSITKLTQIPTGRKPIITEIVPENNREKIYRFIKKELVNSRQAFIITPRVEETEKSNTKSVKTEFERLSKEIFPEYKLGLLYGKMKSADKEKVMKEFNDAKIDILVATSVIEIGIDVPNATIMIIEGAQNFGLAQLHQLRGRVGRGELQSYCFLFTDIEEAQTLERLKTFSSTLDGFKLAEMDLEQRGFGDLFGSEQSGFNYKFSRFITMRTFQLAKEAASWILNKDPKLKDYKELSLETQEYIEKIHLE